MATLRILNGKSVINPDTSLRGGIFEEVVGNIRTFLELSRNHDIRVEIQRMITRQTAEETRRDFEEYFNLDRYPQAEIIEKTCEGLDTSEDYLTTVEEFKKLL